MPHIILPAIWLIVFIVGLPQFSETVYSPALPDIAHDLKVHESLVEYTLTIYLFGIGLGTLFWGKLSDTVGRKPCVLAGILIFIMGCIGCYFSTSIEMLLLSRLIQAFGGGIGSVLGQAICRDSFHGPEAGKAFSIIGSSLAIFPAIGPMIGGVIAQQFGWSNIFLFLTAVGIILMICVALKLPETHHKENRLSTSLLKISLALAKDKKVLALGLIVGASNGLMFSYFAEGPFYLIEILGLSPSMFGFSFLGIAASSMAGGILSKKLNQSIDSILIMKYGLIITFFSTLIFSLLILWHVYVFQFSTLSVVILTVLAQMATMFGVCMSTSNALAICLQQYKWCIGTASSLFGFFYYSLISLFTLGMGFLHNGSLLPMPLYFFVMALFGFLVHRYIYRHQHP
jgi:Bcr/CflA subfamily drug resistance transporter